MYSVHKDSLPALLAVWSSSYMVFAPQRSTADSPVLLTPFDSTKNVCLDYINFPKPVPDFTLPERLFTWEQDKDGMHASPPVEHAQPQLLFGVRPCDVAGLARRDVFYSGEYADPVYLARRHNMVIVALNCVKAGEHCFCDAVDCGPFATQGADIIATQDGDMVLLQPTHAKGHVLLGMVKKLLGGVKPEQGAERLGALLDCARASFVSKPDMANVDTALAALYNSSLWDEQARQCINCTGCTMVCPTCTCFQTVEHVTGEASGERVRYKDSCQTGGFTRNAGWHNPRSRTASFRYRIMDKLMHVAARFGNKACIGCGRCIQVCPSGIDITDIAGRIKAAWEAAGTPPPLMAPPKRYEKQALVAEQNLYIPRPAVISSVRDEGRDTRRYTLRYKDAVPGELVDLSGQFYMLTVFGVGEIAVSIPFGDAPGTELEFCIKKVGKVTGALSLLDIGDEVGLRGPYGRGFPYEDLKGHDVLIVGSGVGLAPVRTIIVRMMEQRQNFGRIAIIASATSYGGLVYADDLKYWATQPDVTVLYALSKETKEVTAHVGYINDLLPALSFAWPSTRALLCASPRRIKLVAADLLTLGMEADNIYTSLETHMRCGVGKCGHCKVGSHYMCLDGPVFSYKEMLELPPEF